MTDSERIAALEAKVSALTQTVESLRLRIPGAPIATLARGEYFAARKPRVATE